MSVWDSTTYKLEIAKLVYEHIPDYAPAIIGTKVSDYLQPKGDIVPFDEDDDWNDVALECDWEMNEMDEDEKRKIGALIKNVKSWSIGISAVYKLLHACHTDKFDVKSQYNYENIDQKVRILGQIICPSSMITPESFMKVWNATDNFYVKKARKFEDFSEGWKYLTRYLDTYKGEWAKFDQEKVFGDGERIYYGGNIGQLVIMVGSSSYTQRGLILTKTHLNILIEASARISGILDHISREYESDKFFKDKVYQLLDMTIQDACFSRKFNTDKVVQAYHKARTYMQMNLFNNVMYNTLEEALGEFQKKGLHNVMSLKKYVACFAQIPKAKWLELIHVYKWMPPPDYDSSYAFTELKGYHDTVRSSGLDASSSDKMKDLWSLVEKERKLNIACAYKKLYGDWPKDLEIASGSPTEVSLDEWEPNALFAYHAYGKDVTGQIKDKTTVLARLADEVKIKGPNDDRSFLLWFLKNRHRIDTIEIAKNFMNGYIGEENYVRVAYKGEAHKPSSRLFFMAPPLQRILLGELEGNLSRIANVYPASLQGMDALRRADALEKVFDVYDTTYVQDAGEVYTCYVVTFDLSKFSPRFNPKVLENLHVFWSKVFAYEPIAKMRSIGADSVILHTTDGLIMKYKNKGADLEGFRGRMMTLFHADLIAAACRLSVKRGHTVGNAKTAVFIDDGAVRIAAKGIGKEAKRNALAFLECMRDVYESAGQENHPNKTIVSQIGGELLAEQYLFGQKLKCPIKAGMRLYPNYENPASSITEEFDSMFATIQGSIKDGARWVVAYRRYAEAFIKSIVRWNRKGIYKLDHLKFAFKVVTPKSLGGFGFPTLQALTSTTAYDLTIEGLGILNTIGRCVPSYTDYIELIINRPVMVRKPLHILRDAGRVRLEGPILIEGRLVSRIIERLKEKGGPASDLIKAYTSEEIVGHAEQVAICVLSQRSVSLPVLKRIWDSTPLAYLEGIIQKFKRSASIKLVLGEKGLTAIRRANQRDVMIVSSFTY